MLVEELSELCDQFEDIKRDAQDLISGLTEEQFNWRTEPGRWSIAECLDHLNLTANLYGPIIESGINNGRAAELFRRGPFRHTWFGNWFVRSLEPPPKFKAKAPTSFRPSPDQKIAGVVTAFFSNQERLLNCVRDANGLHLAKIRVHSPTLKLVRLTLGQSLRLMAAHERRHLWQARQVKSHPSFPTAGLPAH